MFAVYCPSVFIMRIKLSNELYDDAKCVIEHRETIVLYALFANLAMVR